VRLLRRPGVSLSCNRHHHESRNASLILMFWALERRCVVILNWMVMVRHL